MNNNRYNVKSCPWCGETTLDITVGEENDEKDFSVTCTKCGCCGPLQSSPLQAVIYWNLRWCEKLEK